MEYFLGKDGERFGPMSLADVQARLADGSFKPSDLVWTVEQTDWMPISQHPLFGAPPPVPSAGQESLAGGRIMPTLGAPVAAAPETATAVSDKEALYEAFIGPEKSPYYLPVFRQFDRGGSAASWNWPAAFVTQFWMLYRGMFLWGFLYYPLLSFAVGIVLVMVLGATSGDKAAALYYVISIPASIIVMGLYSNKIFHGHVNKMIERSERLGLTATQRREWLIRKGASSVLWALVVVFVGVALIGILAAIALPAYQDYVNRAKVAGSLTQVEPIKQRYIEVLRTTGQPPADMKDLEVNGRALETGPNLASVSLGENHELRLTFRGTPIEGRTLVLIPDAGSKTVVWTCHVETLPARYAPRDCRG